MAVLQIGACATCDWRMLDLSEQPTLPPFNLLGR